MVKNVLITGAKGQLGTEVTNVFTTLGGFKIYSEGRNGLDITNKSSVEYYFANHDIDCVINCAAYTNVDGAENDMANCAKLNIDGVANLAKSANKYGANIVHISTDYVFDGFNYMPYTEEDRTNPLSVYGTTKLEGERALLDNNPKSIIIRTSWLYSPYGNNFVKTMMRLAKERNEINVVCDQIGTPTSVSDLAQTIYHIISKDKWINGIYNYSNEGVASWFDFAKAIMKASNKNVIINPIFSKEYPTTAIRPFYSILNKTKIKRTFNIEIPYWEESLIECINRLK